MSGKCPLHWFSACVYLHNQHKALVHHYSGNNLPQHVLILLCFTLAFFFGFFLGGVGGLNLYSSNNSKCIGTEESERILWFENIMTKLNIFWQNEIGTLMLVPWKRLMTLAEEGSSLQRYLCRSTTCVALEWHFTIWDVNRREGKIIWEYVL